MEFSPRREMPTLLPSGRNSGIADRRNFRHTRAFAAPWPDAGIVQRVVA